MMNDMEPIFMSKLIQACITRINIVDNYVLAGIGGNINIYNVNNAVFLRRFKIFEGSKIHGIEINLVDKQIFIYSGLKMKLVRYQGDFEKFSREPSSLSQDWILAAKFIDNNSRIVTVTMNNILQTRNLSLEVTEEYSCTERSILYSATIGFNVFDDLLVFAGTAFGNLLVWKPLINDNKKCHVQETLKGHKGVILSVDFNEDMKMVCTTSDDRSSILWAQEGLKHKKFEKKCRVYGHQARVFCCKVLSNFFMTAGEDSVLNIWNLDGTLLRMVEPHQGGAIRSLGYHADRNYVLSGGEDGSLTSFSAFTTVESKKIDMPRLEAPRHIVLLATGNVLAISENGYLFCYNVTLNKWICVDHYKELDQCSLLEVSPCRKCLALVGFHGEMYFYKEIKGTVVKKCTFKLETQSKIAGAYWLNCKNFITYENEGRVFSWDVQKNSIEMKYQYMLPWNGERRLTAACLHKDCLVIGDRKGHLHVYNKKEFPIRSMMKVHSSQGVSKLYSISNVVVSLGRDALLKMHRLEKDLRLTAISADKLPFTWLGSLYKNYLIGFSSDSLVMWDIKARRTLIKSPCGGGHRSWDFNENCFIYVKSKGIYIKNFDLQAILPLDFISGYHVKEINCLKALRIGGYYILASGGEDTVLRLKKMDLTQERVQLCSIKKFKSHLSTIKTIAFHKVDEGGDKVVYLMFYGGGREQILMYKLNIGVVNSNLDVTCIEQDSYYNKKTNDAETRIMDMDIVEYNKRIMLFAACSNGNILVFKVVKGDSLDDYVLKFMKTVKYKLRCLLKITSLVSSNIKILLTMATDGLLVFWNFSEILNNDNPNYFDAIPAHQSGLNSYSIKTISDTRILILTGGDDNAVVLNLIEFTSADTLKCRLIDSFKDVGVHCALISGAFICDKFFVTTSIDQRVLLFGWEIIDDKLKCRCVSMFHTAIADVQGMECFNNGRLDLFVYGNGLEYITSRRILSE